MFFFLFIETSYVFIKQFLCQESDTRGEPAGKLSYPVLDEKTAA